MTPGLACRVLKKGFSFLRRAILVMVNSQERNNCGGKKKQLKSH
jgi:hypothetical protein